MTKYNRVLLKLSGEALCANTDGILNFEFISDIAQQIRFPVCNFYGVYFSPSKFEAIVHDILTCFFIIDQL